MLSPWMHQTPVDVHPFAASPLTTISDTDANCVLAFRTSASELVFCGRSMLSDMRVFTCPTWHDGVSVVPQPLQLMQSMLGTRVCVLAVGRDPAATFAGHVTVAFDLQINGHLAETDRVTRHHNLGRDDGFG
ncbi:hypothetical protein CH292_19195 [Rhodococcus sp. 14-2470-1a]|nr:hypothetical protein CH292_19195 [Rhodococcus sp. 14-2470-1a]